MTAEALETKNPCIHCTLHCRSLPAPVDLQALSLALADRRSPSILGANVSVKEAGRFSYWAAEPREVFEFRPGSSDPLGQLEDLLGKYRLCDSPTGQRSLPDGMFRGGWIGWFGYELGRYIERLPQTATDDLAMPLIHLRFYDRLLAYDHQDPTFWLVALELPDDTESPEDKMAVLEQWLSASQSIRPPHPRHANIEHIDLSKTRGNMAKADYLRAVDRIKRYIRDGDVYQVNFSQRFARPFTGRAIDLFHWQNCHNPSPYAAYLDAGSFQIVSASPEMFVTVRNGLIQTKPIKGTRRRLPPDGPGQEANRRNLQDLLTNEKEQAELNMIIDLERNDIARICRPGTRRVVQPRTIETYPTVFHAVATVAGQLRSDVSFADILKAVFPGGSITGAPKIRAMEIIDELEPTARGVYTGSIGFIGLDGTVCLNIAIRTVIIAAHQAFVQTGGGIVADSDPEAEWEETITKARALLAGIEAVQQP